MYLVIHKSEYENDVFNIEEMVHTLFTCLLGVLLIYLFHYTSKRVCIKGSAKKIIFILGIVLILGAIKKIIKSYYKYDKLDFLDEIALKI
jgi:cytochrome c oxidase assembly factor CtaG